MEKKCNKCKEIKPVSEFGIESRAKNGYKPRCKKCTNEQYNKDYPKFKHNKSIHNKLYYSENSEAIKKRSMNYKKKTPEEIRVTKRKWREKNRMKIREKMNSYIKDKCKSDPVFKTKRNMRNLIYKVIKDKSSRTSDVLGYSYSDLIEVIGENMEGKHIDHKIPVSWFMPDVDIKLINSLENLHLLSASENVQKHNCFAHPVSIEYLQLIEKYIKPKYLQLLKTN